MENRAHALAAGLFTLLLGAAVVLVGLWFGRENIQSDNYVLHTLGTVAGLNPQATVRLRGVDVGKVTSIGFDPQDTRVILVGIAVQPGTPIGKGAHAQLAAQGVTGLAYVQLQDDGTPGTLRNPADPNDARIELRPSFFERFSVSGEQLVVRLEETARRVNDWLGEGNQTQAVRTLAAIEKAADRFGALGDRLAPGATAVTALARDAAGTLDRANALVADLRALTAAVGQRLDALDRVAAAAERIGATAQQLAAAGSGVAASASQDTLPRMNLLLDDIGRSARALERLLDELNHQPASLVFGKGASEAGPGEPGFVHGGRR